MSRIARTRRHIAANPADDFFLGLNRGRSQIFCSQLGRETILGRGNAVLLSNAEAGEVRAQSKNSWFLLAVPKRLLDHLIGDAEDLLARPLDPNGAALRHLRFYLDLLLAPEGVDDDPPLLAHVGTTLADLIALVLGADRDAAEIAEMRGLRAARAQEVLAEIKAGIADPDFSTNMVAQKLGLSPRYIQELLQETGRTFSERVLELRLQQARVMLSDVRHGRLRISDIALACGFNEVSYFNRCFRRRFGASPTQYRGGNGSADD
jgi:AraC-like DNA-binding protein